MKYKYCLNYVNCGDLCKTQCKRCRKIDIGIKEEYKNKKKWN